MSTDSEVVKNRRLRHRSLAVVLLLVSTFALAAQSASAASTVKVRTGVQYTVDGGAPQYLDMYSPAKPTAKMRAAIFVHGGGWTGGTRTEWAQDAQALAAAGWVAVTIDYPLNAPALYVSEPQDVRAAVGWLQHNARTYGVDPARIALIGSSAGGQLAALQATTGTGAPGTTGRVKALVSWSGPMDLALLTSEFGCLNQQCSYSTQWSAAMAQYFEGGCLPASCPDRWAATSPIDQVDAGDPATLLVNSSDEVQVPVEQLQVMQQRLSAAGVPVTTQVIPGTLHATAYNSTAWPTTLAFLQATV